MIFLDTSFLFALVDSDDENHTRVRAVLDGVRGKRLSDLVVTTNHVLAETVTTLRVCGRSDDRLRHARALRMGEQLYAGTWGRLHQVSAEEERAALDYFARYEDKEYSFVDCVSFVVMEQLGIHEAWTTDSDFTHRFTAVPGPRPK